jgi:O-acetyl-ADP-ribose deacetylase (regulator of RNase III)/pimeloyl-ACP methyl ester carboxylesterase
MQDEQTYTIGKSTLVVRIGNLRDATTEVVVTSDDQQLSMGGGTSKAIREAAGDAVLEARKQVPVKLGGVVSSGAGNMAAQGVKYVFHAATIPTASNRNVADQKATVAAATRQALAMLQAMGLTSIAFPALGTGHARFDVTTVAIAMSSEICQVLTAAPTALRVEIVLLLGIKRDMEAVRFFKEFTTRAQLTNHAVKSHAVILVHGIRTAAGWRVAIGSELKDADRRLTPTCVGYGFFDIFRFLTPVGPWRRAAARTVWKKMNSVFNNSNFDQVSIIAHSFGTWIVGHILENYPEAKFHRVILCGSVLDTEYDWNGVQNKVVAPYFDDAPNAKIVNECGTKDIWPVFAQFTTWGYGVAGRWGFQHSLVKDRFHHLDHSGFFQPGFATQYWVPVLNGKVTEGVDKDISPSALVSILTVLKLPYVLLALALVLWVIYLF